MSFAEVCQILVREPFNLSFEQIADLTDYQIAEILFKHPADTPAEKPPDGNNLTHEELFWRVWQRRGLSEEQIAEKWRAESQGNNGSGQ